jgi:peptidoglycan/xylan/chitin deacetylase (PgdA/CDA1 family)
MKRKLLSIALAVVFTAGLGAGFIPTVPKTLANVVGAGYGDINGDGYINAADVTLLRRYVAAANKNTFISNNQPFYIENARVLGGTGNPTAAEVTQLRRYLAASDPSSVRLGPIGKMVSLTFDDGPTGYTDQILNYLETLNRSEDIVSGKYPPVRVTFYVTGDAIHYVPTAVERMVRAHKGGHAIENHTERHPPLGDESLAGARRELAYITNLVSQTRIPMDWPPDGIEGVGKRPWSFRPPYYDTGPVLAGLDVEFQQYLISGGIDTDDYRPQHTAQVMANFILNGARGDFTDACGCAGTAWCSIRGARAADGSVWKGARGENGWGADGANILMHDGGGDRTRTVNSLPLFIPQMLELGYEFVTVEEHYTRKGITPCRFLVRNDTPPWKSTGSGWGWQWPNNENRTVWHNNNRVNDWIKPAGTPGGCNHNPRCQPF